MKFRGMTFKERWASWTPYQRFCACSAIPACLLAGVLCVVAFFFFFVGKNLQAAWRCVLVANGLLLLAATPFIFGGER